MFPLFCLQCQQEGTILCSKCSSTLPFQSVFCCPVCATRTPAGQPCSECHDKSFLSAHGAFFIYEEGKSIAQLIHAIKYNFIEDAFLPFIAPLNIFYKNNPQFFDMVDVVVPLPLHRRRLAERGFNQSEHIATLVSKQCGLPVQKSVIRTRVTRPQAQLSQLERKKNVKNAFVAGSECAGKHILLVDDVFTTGSTMQSCAEALLHQGAISVTALTLARAL